MPESSLDRLRNDVAIVENLRLPEASAKRLKSLGVFKGQRIELARRGNPLIVKAAGSRIAIAEGIAKHIFVREVSE